MKHQFCTSLLSVLGASLLALTPLHVNALVAPAYKNLSYTVETGSFRYQPDDQQMHLDSTVASAAEANCMITGVFYQNSTDETPLLYSIISINDTNGEYGGFFMEDQTLRPYCGKTLEIGDLLYCEWYKPYEISNYPAYLEGDARLIGNGRDLLGEEFLKVMRHELVTELYTTVPHDSRSLPDFVCTIPDDLLIYGDATNDTDVSLTDVVAVNQNILGVRRLGSYAQQVSDVDRDGEITANDSLRILRYTVSLTDSLD